MVKDPAIKLVFESVIAILTLIRVRFFAQFLILYLLIDDRTRTTR